MKRLPLIFLLTTIATLGLISCEEKVKDAVPVEEWPIIYPDYRGVTVPCNIAPLCFGMDEKEQQTYTLMDVELRGNQGTLHVQGTEADFPIKEWHQLLNENRGDSITVSVCAKKDGHWIQFRSFCIYVSNDSIDYGIAYRRVAPGYEYYGHMGFYERNLTNFDEQPILENNDDPNMCINCHMTNRGNPQYQTMHVRGNHDGTMMVTPTTGRQILTTRTDSTLSSFVYPYWHPSGNYIAYSTNRTRQYFHEQKDLRIEVADQASDVVVYHPESGKVLRCTLLENKDAFETFPAFSPDGKTLYFCRAEARQLPVEYEQVRYSLCSITFDPKKGTFGEAIDTLVSCQTLAGSITFPRPSYDGKYILFTRSDYGTFPIWHREADLWMLNLSTGSIQPANKLNSEDTESYHSWSSTSKWVIYGSRRDDGLYTRLYIAHIQPDGTAAKPFLLPQRHPKTYYGESLYSFSVPDFLSSPLNTDQKGLFREVQSATRHSVTYR